MACFDIAASLQAPLGIVHAVKQKRRNRIMCLYDHTTFRAQISKTGSDKLYCWWASSPLLLRSDIVKIVNQHMLACGW